jgi:hypothetical protein
MNTQTMTLEQIRTAGLAVLFRELGPVDTVRFLQQYETGQGDYSVERHEWLGKKSVDQIAQALQSRTPQEK